jgi:hypothetical protein
VKVKNWDDVIALGTAAGFFTASAALVLGWIFNVVSIWHSIDNPITAKFILRCIGIFVFPIGGILGYL